MNDLELILGTEIIPLSFGMKIEDVKKLFKIEMVVDSQSEDSRSYLVFDTNGFSISFNENELSTVSCPRVRNCPVRMSATLTSP
jgi:hypothetical protein